jgi:hypothetical protein
VTEDKKKFDPASHMRPIKVKGGGTIMYLGAWPRLLWLRDEHPEAQVVSEIVAASDNMARFKCTITLANGAIAVAHGQENAAAFGDYFEKAETTAFARACAVLGYGTESANDLDDRTPATAPEGGARAQMNDQLLPSAVTWFKRELPKRGMSLPRRFEKWGDVIGTLQTAGHETGDAIDDRGIDFAAIKALVEALPVVSTAQPQRGND